MDSTIIHLPDGISIKVQKDRIQHSNNPKCFTTNLEFSLLEADYEKIERARRLVTEFDYAISSLCKKEWGRTHDDNKSEMKRSNGIVTITEVQGIERVYFD